MVVGNEDGSRINGPGKATRKNEGSDLTPLPRSQRRVEDGGAGNLKISK